MESGLSSPPCEKAIVCKTIHFVTEMADKDNMPRRNVPRQMLIVFLMFMGSILLWYGLVGFIE